MNKIVDTDIEVYSISCSSVEEIPVPGDDNNIWQLYAGFRTNYFVFIENRGILYCVQQAGNETTVMSFIMHSKGRLASASPSDIEFRRVNILKNSETGHLTSVIYTDVTEEDLCFLTFNETVSSKLLGLFTTYSKYYYKDPFDVQSKRILYVGDVEFLVEKDISYSRLKLMVSMHSGQIVGRKDVSGIYYLCDKKLIYAIPEVIRLEGSAHCVTKYFLCKSSEDNKVIYESITADDLPIIVDTVSLFAQDKVLEDASAFACKDGDNLFKSSLSAIGQQTTNITIRQESRLKFLKFLGEVSEQHKTFVFCLGYFNDSTTDFVLMLNILEKQVSPLGLVQEVSRYYWPTDMFHDIYIWRIMKYISDNYMKSGMYKSFSVFANNYKVIVGSDLSMDKVAKLLDSYWGTSVYPIIYDISKECFYLLDIVLMTHRRLIRIKFAVDQHARIQYDIDIDSSRLSSGSGVYWVSQPTVMGKDTYLPAYSLLQNIRRHFGKTASIELF